MLLGIVSYRLCGEVFNLVLRNVLGVGFRRGVLYFLEDINIMIKIKRIIWVLYVGFFSFIFLLVLVFKYGGNDVNL